MTSPWDGLHVLADDDPRWPRDPVEQTRQACAGGAAVVQLRAKHATDSEALQWARRMRTITRESGVRLVVNDRFDLALACEADAVHLGQTDLPPGAVPSSLRARLAVGRSTHDLAQAKASVEEELAYVAFGPIFGTRSKESEYDARGLPALAEVARVVAPRPLVAIGGIDLPRARSVLGAGARGIAVIQAVAGAEDPAAAVRSFCSAMTDR